MSLRGRKKVKSPQTPPQESKASISQACGTYFYSAYPHYPLSLYFILGLI